MHARQLLLVILEIALLAACAASSASPLKDLPVPDDAKPLQVTENYDHGYVTKMIEPEVFDFYATWLADHGWRQQAPTEAYLSLPHQLWRKDGLELLIELQETSRDEGLTTVWLKVTDLDATP